MTHRIRVRFNEVDRQGIAHNSVPLVYFGVALNEYFRGLGYSQLEMGARDGTGLHAVHASVVYKAPINLDAEIEIGARIAKLGRTSLTFVYEIYLAGSDDLLVAGDQVWVNTNTTSHRP